MRLSLLLLVVLVTTTFAADIRTAKLHLTYTSDEKMNRNVGRLEEVLGALVPEYTGAASLGILTPAVSLTVPTATVTNLTAGSITGSASLVIASTGIPNSVALTPAIGGPISLQAGNGDTSNAGGSVTVSGGTGFSTNRVGGSILLLAGRPGAAGGTAGDITLTPGASGLSQSASNTGKVTISGRPVYDIEAPATIPDDGAGTKPTLTVTAYAPIIRLNCADATGCAITVSTTGATDGQTVLIVGATGSTANNFANSSGLAVSTSPRLVSANDTLSLLFNGSTSKWVEVAYADN